MKIHSLFLKKFFWGRKYFIHNFRLIIDGGVCASAENTRFCLGNLFLN